MKKYLIFLALSVAIINTIPQPLFAGNATKRPLNETTIVTSEENKEENKQAEILLNRLNEIKALDKSSLTFSEKRELRKEVRSIKSQLREMGGGVYLSVGAIIIIILLLILLL